MEAIVNSQRAFFASGATRSQAFRELALSQLRHGIAAGQDAILAALQEDLGKAPFEGYMAEVGLAMDEVRFLQKHLGKWMRDKRVPTPLTHFPARSTIKKEPYGVALVMAPWNYPFLLSIEPLAGAIAAGNCVVLKPSAYAPATSRALKQLLEGLFPSHFVAVVEGGRAENTQLLEQRFDYIFFTGSVEVGKLVMEKAARHLTPVTLELGGKSPSIVDESADIALAARRIVFGKFLNAGQTCVAPDYVLVHHRAEKALLAALEQAIAEAFGPQPLQNPELPKIVNEKHYQRLLGLLRGEAIACGGQGDGTRIAPTVLAGVKPGAPVMREEIFGPILPVLPVEDMWEAVAFVRRREKPLALYLFCRDAQVEADVLANCSFGGGCVNDTIMHLASSHLPFGGAGHSGMGSYHGKKSFDTFTHEKSILKKAAWPDVPVRYHPYTAAKEKLLRRLLR